MLLILVVFATTCLATDLLRDSNETCEIYTNASWPNTHCNQSCGTCQNIGSRPGLLCFGTDPGASGGTGYNCPSDSSGGHDMAFACMDWTFGSKAMRDAEAQFNSRTGDDVYFGIGTYGNSKKTIGACFRINVTGMSKNIIAQSVNTGSDVAGNQFDMQVGDGGAGLFNSCAGGSNPGVNTMFPGPYSLDTWGKQYGGVDNRSGCVNLPPYPHVDGPMKKAGDDLITMCQYSFDHGARGEAGANPSIKVIGRVQCPEELAYMSQIQRTDDPIGYIPKSPLVAEHDCEASIPGMPLDWCLTRMMDCRKPTGGWRPNVDMENMKTGRKMVQPCTSDGYTRIDIQCGCFSCWC